MWSNIAILTFECARLQSTTLIVQEISHLFSCRQPLAFLVGENAKKKKNNLFPGIRKSPIDFTVCDNLDNQ